MKLPLPVNGWEEQGRRIARRLDDVAAALIVGDDPVEAAHVAIGIARIQGLHRRVAIVDLVGELAPLRVAGDDDPHGITDCFLYGVSLNRIARPVRGAPNLFILPSGTEPVVPVDVLRHERWRRLIAGFREMDALLLLVTPPLVSEIEPLARATDGVIAVGTPDLGSIPALARIRLAVRPSRLIPEEHRARLGSDSSEESVTVAPAAAAMAGATVVDSADVRAAAAVGEAGSTIATEPVVASSDALAVGGDARSGTSSAATRVRRRRWPAVAAAAVVVVAAGAFGAVTLVRARADRATRADAGIPLAAVADSAAGAVGAPRDAAPPVFPTNPQDSVIASAYAVEVVKANTEAGALAHLRDEGSRLPAMTVAPVTLGDGSRWYRVLAGAFRTPLAAESLLIELRGTPVLADDPGRVVRAPYALLALAGADTVMARREITRLRERGISAYGLVQPAGTVHVYVGAFESPEEAAAAEGSLREAGVVPAVVYRIGRAF